MEKFASAVVEAIVFRYKQRIIWRRSTHGTSLITTVLENKIRENMKLLFHIYNHNTETAKNESQFLCITTRPKSKDVQQATTMCYNNSKCVTTTKYLKMSKII